MGVLLNEDLLHAEAQSRRGEEEEESVYYFSVEDWHFFLNPYSAILHLRLSKQLLWLVWDLVV